MLMLKKQEGITLLELLIALAVSTVVVGALVGLFFISTKHNRGTLEITKLDSELNLVLNSMTRDVQRAGYWADAQTSSNNPFMVTGTTDITINGSNDCILLTYDRNADGALTSAGNGTDDERYGYRLSNNAIQYRAVTTNFSCTNSDWLNLTDTRVITITAFSVALNTEDVDIDGTGPGTSVMQVRSVTITVTGELADDSSVTRTLTRNVKVYNDKYIP